MPPFFLLSRSGEFPQHTTDHWSFHLTGGDGTFAGVSEETGIAKHLRKGLNASFADYDHEDFPELRPDSVPRPRAPSHGLKETASGEAIGCILFGGREATREIPGE